MTAESNMTLCIFCGSEPKRTSFPICDPDQIPIETVHKFVEQILEEGTKASRKSKRLSSSASFIDSVHLCEVCSAGIARATGCCEQILEVERDVRSLQRIILKMMHQLKTLQTDYLLQMKQLKGKIRGSEEKIGAESGRKNMRILEKVGVLRKAVLTVVEELDVFQNKGKSRHVGQETNICKNPPENVNPQPEVQQEQILDKEHEVEDTKPSSFEQPVAFLPTPKQEKNEASVTARDLVDPLRQDDISSPEDNIDIEFSVFTEDPLKHEAISSNDRLILPESDHQSSSDSLPPPPSPKKRKRGRKKKIPTATTKDGKVCFPCQYCGKLFSQLCNLKRHENFHTGERPYKCPKCPKAFLYDTNLSQHLLYHSGKRAFKCSFCPKAFHVKFDLKRHERIHNGEKPYSCHVCGKRFTIRWNTKQHIKSQHPHAIAESPYN